MTRPGLALVPALLLALLPAVPAAAADRVHGDPVLLALGDSVPAGVGAVPKVSGYPELTRSLLAGSYNTAAGKATPNAEASLELINLGDPTGVTSETFAGQVTEALEIIAERQADRDPKNDVEVITLTIGGNDVFGPAVAACVLDPTPDGCQSAVELALEQVSTNATAALAALTEAAGKHTEVVVTTYYDPIGSCVLTRINPAAPAIADVVLEGGALPGLLTLEDGLNDVLREAAQATGAQVADLYGEVVAGQFVGGLDCLHPNQSGHVAIAGVVAETLSR